MKKRNPTKYNVNLGNGFTLKVFPNSKRNIEMYGSQSKFQSELYKDKKVIASSWNEESLQSAISNAKEYIKKKFFEEEKKSNPLKKQIALPAQFKVIPDGLIRHAIAEAELALGRHASHAKIRALTIKVLARALRQAKGKK